VVGRADLNNIGVYFLRDSLGDVIYVGKGKLWSRIGAHARENKIPFCPTNIRVLPCENGLVKATEVYFIGKLKPRYNFVHNPTSPRRPGHNRLNGYCRYFAIEGYPAKIELREDGLFIIITIPGGHPFFGVDTDSICAAISMKRTLKKFGVKHWVFTSPAASGRWVIQLPRRHRTMEAVAIVQSMAYKMDRIHPREPSGVRFL
jgi:hypothetical protein